NLPSFHKRLRAVTTQHFLKRNFPNVIGVHRMPHVVICGPVTSTKIVSILGKQGTARSKLANSPIRYLVERMSVGIVDLNDAAAPPRKPVLERNNHSVVVGNGRGSVQIHLSKPCVITRLNWWTAARHCWIRTKIMRVHVQILEVFMNAMIPKIADGQRRRTTNILLCLQAPFLVLR